MSDCKVLIAFLAAACQLSAAAQWQQEVERSARLVQARAAAETPALTGARHMAAIELLKKVEPPKTNELHEPRSGRLK